jgi:hypothetical protein
VSGATPTWVRAVPTQSFSNAGTSGGVAAGSGSTARTGLGETGPFSVCGVLADGERRLEGAGAGTPPTELAPGVAMKIAAGEQLVMNLHLFNASQDVLRGKNGMRVKVLPKAQVKNEAEVRLIGPLQLQIPRGARFKAVVAS